MPTTTTYTGHVTYYSNKTGFGFVSVKGIRPDEPARFDVFVHYSAIVTQTPVRFRFLVAGEAGGG